MQLPSTRPRSGTDLIAHRGASGHAPEHTIEAYDLAIELGADVLEIDVRLLGDGTLVVIHDETLQRTAADPRSVMDLDAEDLARLPRSLRPLLLDEVLRRYSGSSRFLIDLKDPSPAVAAGVAEMIARLGMRGAVQVQAFGAAGLQQMRAADRFVSLAQLYEPGRSSREIADDLPRVSTVADTIGPYAASVDADLVLAAHRAGLRVQPYTVNDPNEVSRLLAGGVDGIITDLPDVVTTCIEALTHPVAAAA